MLWCRDLHEKVVVPQEENSLHFTELRNLLPCLQGVPLVHILSQWIQSTSFHPISLRSGYHLCLGLSSGLFSSGFTTETQNAFLFCPLCAILSAHLILLALIILMQLFVVHWFLSRSYPDTYCSGSKRVGGEVTEVSIRWVSSADLQSPL